MRISKASLRVGTAPRSDSTLEKCDALLHPYGIQPKLWVKGEAELTLTLVLFPRPDRSILLQRRGQAGAWGALALLGATCPWPPALWGCWGVHWRWMEPWRSQSTNRHRVLLKTKSGASLVVQWPRFHTPNAGGPGWISGQGTEPTCRD